MHCSYNIILKNAVRKRMPSRVWINERTWLALPALRRFKSCMRTDVFSSSCASGVVCSSWFTRSRQKRRRNMWAT